MALQKKAVRLSLKHLSLAQPPGTVSDRQFGADGYLLRCVMPDTGYIRPHLL